jgi:glyoxylase-like metal-dependent hydrolase (beta-lactamase superfamily II)
MYTVKILTNGTWSAPGTVIYSHAFGHHDPVAIAQHFFLLSSDAHTVVVDTGLDQLESYLSPERRAQLAAPPSRSTAELLSDHGVDPGEVDALILTHLHFDHYANARLFTRARVVVNRTEFAYVMDPANRRYAPRVGFPREVFGWLADDAWERLELVSGDASVLPGIRVIETGGHSPGHQIVTVETNAGLVVIPGDEVYLYENLQQAIPIGYYHDFSKVTAAMDLLSDLGGVLLPAHDPRVLERFPGAQIG